MQANQQKITPPSSFVKSYGGTGTPSAMMTGVNYFNDVKTGVFLCLPSAHYACSGNALW
jgi:hypothetical protein